MAKKIFISRNHDPHMNLAMEEYIFDSLSAEDHALLLYKNNPCVVLGKHQNPWRETSLRMLKATGTPLVRRISGGGAVYHDLGNLNFSFISAKKQHSRRENLQIVQDGLRALGIDSEATEGYDLYAYGRKFSGNSFCFRREKVLHHGTILLDADMNNMRRFLTPEDLAIATHAVKSRPAHTVSLKTMHPLVTDSDVVQAITMRFLGKDDNPIATMPVEAAENQTTADLALRNKTWDWIYGRTPSFTCEIPVAHLLDRRRVVYTAVCLEVIKGRIHRITGEDRLADLDKILSECRFCKAEITSRAGGMVQRERRILDAIEAILQFAA